MARSVGSVVIFVFSCLVVLVTMVHAADVGKSRQGILQGAVDVALTPANRFSRYCLNQLAPAYLGLANSPEHEQFCNQYRQQNAHAAALITDAARRPQPSIEQQWTAIQRGDQAMRLLEEAASPLVALVEKDGASTSTSSQQKRGQNPGNASKKWPLTDIPFSIDPTLSEANVTNIMWGLNHIERRTCIRFTPVAPNSGDDHIHFVPHRTDCSSQVGRSISGSKHTVNVAPWCGAGGIAHELIHALGFGHTQCRLDRDSYITIDTSNVKSNYKGNYDKRSSPFANYGPYDFQSIMHYPATIPTDWRINPSGATIAITEITGRAATVPAALNSPWSGRSQDLALTVGDAQAVHRVYCPATPVPGASGVDLSNPTGPVPSMPTEARPSGTTLTQVRCLTNNDGANQIYVRSTGNCKRTTYLSCGANSECIPDGSCAGQCVCGRDYINECQCVRVMDPATEVCLNTSPML